ncbi:MAG: hypothetical protein P8X55_17310 [Desulfosarcinaceae bacterium]
MENSRFLRTLKLFILTGLGLVFTAFGVHMLVSAYGLNDPFSLIMTFFASNFIILISATLTFGFIWHLWHMGRAKTGERGKATPPEHEED